MDRKLGAALAVSTALNLALGAAWALSRPSEPDPLGVCVSYSTSNANGTSVTWVSQVGAPIKTAGTQSCVEGSFVPVVAQ